MPRERPARGHQPVTLEGFYSFFDLEQCLVFVGRALERARMTPDDLPPYQRRLYDDLHQPLDEEALADMLAYWLFDFDKLVERGRDGWRAVPAKPKIDVWVEVTSKGNLKAEWLPRGGTIHYTPPDSDFLDFYRRESRTVSYGGRPSNELLFLHDFETAQRHLDYRTEIPTAALDTPLLAASAKAVSRLRERLDLHFDVRMRTDVFVEWVDDDSVPSRDEWAAPPSRISKWMLADPAERQRQAEIDELENLEERYGFSEGALIDAKAGLESRPPGKTSSAPSIHTLADRLARELKKRGLPATKGKVERALALVERYRVSAAASNVVSLRPLDERRS